MCVAQAAHRRADSTVLHHALHRTARDPLQPQELRKSKIVACKQQANVVAERLVLDAVRHPFIPRLYRTFRTQRKLYMLLELVQVRAGGRVCWAWWRGW